MSGVQLLALSRFAFAVAQIAAVVYFGFLYYHRTDGSPRAASTMDANHVLTAQDLDFLESKEFLGKVLKVHVEAGSRISRDQVAPRPPAIAPVRPGTVAAAGSSLLP